MESHVHTSAPRQPVSKCEKEIKSNKAVAIFIVAAKWKNAMRLPVSKLIVYVF